MCNAKRANILQEGCALATTKEACKLLLNSQNILSKKKRIKYTHCLMDLKMKSNLELSDIKKERISNCIHLISLSELCPSFHLPVRASRIS